MRKTCSFPENVAHGSQHMTTSLLSPKYQIVIPKKIRQDLGLKPGQRLQITAREGHVEIHPVLAPEQHKLPLADSLIYAITLAHNATLWTQDDHFDGLPNVQCFPKINP